MAEPVTRLSDMIARKRAEETDFDGDALAEAAATLLAKAREGHRITAGMRRLEQRVVDALARVEQRVAEIPAPEPVDLSALPQPVIDVSGLEARVADLGTALQRDQAQLGAQLSEPLRSLAAVSEALAAAARSIATLNSTMAAMAKDLADLKKAATAPRRIMTDVNGDPIGLKIET